MPARNTKKSTTAGTEERNILDAAFGNEGKKPPAYHVNEKEEPRDERNILDAAFGNEGKKPPQYHVNEKQEKKEDERNILDAAFGNEGKKPPTYHSREDTNDTEERKDWHDAVDKYIDDSEDAMNLTAADLRQHLESTIDSATLIESASAIDDYFERRVAIRRRGGIANAMKEQSATATHSTSNGQQIAQEKPERNILDAAFGNEGKKAPAYHQDEKQSSTARRNKESGSQDKDERSILDAAFGNEGKKAPTYHSREDTNDTEERKDWHDAVDKFIDSAEEVSTLTVSGLMEHLQSTIDATTTVQSASAIEDYFERRVAIRRRGGIENALQDDRTTPVKRDRSVSADSVSGTAAKAAKTA